MALVALATTALLFGVLPTAPRDAPRAPATAPHDFSPMLSICSGTGANTQCMCAGTPAPGENCSYQLLTESPVDFHLIYNESKTLATSSGGRGETVALIETYTPAENVTQLNKDYAAFDAKFGLPDQPLTYYWYNISGNAINSSAAAYYDYEWGWETALDVEYSHAMAPNASIAVVYAPYPDLDLLRAVGFAVNHSLANVISMSWGMSSWAALSDGSAALLNPILQKADAERISVFAASGDCGSYGDTLNLTTTFPASSPYLTAVGGTRLVAAALNGNPNSSQPTRAWREAETAWNGTGQYECNNTGGSGGGYGPFARPAYQTALGNISGRGVPDVAFDAETVVPVIENGLTFWLGGTSLASPAWAGIAALLDAGHGSALGFLNPLLYGIYNNTALYHETFLPVTQGSNGYNCTSGWSPVTGLGVPNVGALYQDLAAPTAPTPGGGGGVEAG